MSRGLLTRTAAILMIGAGVVVALLNVRVADEATGTTRACGSGFDSAVDRSGWEQWWLHDLDEPDAAVRSLLLRTRDCPAAVNRRTAVAGLLAASGVSVAASQRWRHRRPEHDVQRSEVAGRLVLLGKVTAAVGGGLDMAGLVAIVVFLADADALVFRYVDRPVAFIAGLVVMAPAAIMVALGMAISALGRQFDRLHLDA